MNLQFPPQVKLHPQTIKHLKKGHPWVTKDSFTSKFPDLQFISCLVQDMRYLYIHDFKHPKIKARLWNTLHKNISHWGLRDFDKELHARLEESLKKRLDKNIHTQRENFYWCFGEGDRLPGLFILVLKDIILIQTYSYFWKNYKAKLLQYLKKIIEDRSFGSEIKYYAYQERNHQQKVGLEIHNALLKKIDLKEINTSIKEFGINYNIVIGKEYDCGIYTDMASVRNILAANEFHNKSVLNLFCYSGAFSLFALKNKAKHVTSVDMAKRSQKMLEDNLESNQDLNNNHQFILDSVEQALVNLNKKNEQFDFVIYDPPPFSVADGSGKTSGNGMQDNIDKIKNILTPTGKILVILNTQSVTHNKFKKDIEQICSTSELKFSILKWPQEDCPRPKYFPEGDYLKMAFIFK